MITYRLLWIAQIAHPDAQCLYGVLGAWIGSRPCRLEMRLVWSLDRKVATAMRARKSKHIKNATWPEGCGQRNEKTRKRENQKTEKTEKTRKREIENQKTGTLLAVFGLSSFSPFSRFRVFAVFAFSRFPRFRGFLVFAVFAFSPFSRFRRFRVHRLIPPVFAFSGFRVFVFTGAFTCSVLAFSCHRMDCFGAYFTHAQSCDNVRVHSATEWTASVHTLHMPEAVITFVFIVLRNGLLRNIPYACPKLW